MDTFAFSLNELLLVGTRLVREFHFGTKFSQNDAVHLLKWS
jgi:hypothetical protein